MTLAEGNQMVEALPADCPDPPFRKQQPAEPDLRLKETHVQSSSRRARGSVSASS